MSLESDAHSRPKNNKSLRFSFMSQSDPSRLSRAALAQSFSGTNISTASSLRSAGGFADMELFNILAHDVDDTDGLISPKDFVTALENVGLSMNDCRLKTVKEKLQPYISDEKEMDFYQFVGVVSSAQGLLERTLRDEGALLCIPKWKKISRCSRDFIPRGKDV